MLQLEVVDCGMTGYPEGVWGVDRCAVIHRLLTFQLGRYAFTEGIRYISFISSLQKYLRLYRCSSRIGSRILQIGIGCSTGVVILGVAR